MSSTSRQYNTSMETKCSLALCLDVSYNCFIQSATALIYCELFLLQRIIFKVQAERQFSSAVTIPICKKSIGAVIFRAK